MLAIGVLILFISANLIGCEKKQPPPQATSKPAQAEELEVTMSYDPAKVGRFEIPLDSSIPESQVSTAMNAYFIFDGSGSMNEAAGDQRFRTKLEGARWAVAEFMKHVPPEVNIGLYVFDQRGQREVVPIGPGHHDAFLTAINGVHGGGGTPLATSIRFGVDKLIEQYRKQLGYGEFRLIVVTDGLAKAIPEATKYATQYGIPIYTIGLYVGQDHPLRRYSVSYKAANSFDDLKTGLTETLAELDYFDPTEFTQ